MLDKPRQGNLWVTERPEAREAPGRGPVVMPDLILGRFSSGATHFPPTPLLVHRGEGSEACISSPRKPNGLSHCLFECLIVKASSQAQNHLSVLADRYTERCRGVFDCTRDG
jgi:hypothetical protein